MIRSAGGLEAGFGGIVGREHQLDPQLGSGDLDGGVERVSPDVGVGGLLPCVGLGLRDEPQFPGDVGRGAGQGAVPVEDPGLELAAGHAPHHLRFVA